MVPDSSGASAEASDFTITAQLVDFSIQGVSPSLLGNAGEVTMSVRGAKIPDDALLVLVSPSGARYEPVQNYQDADGIFFPTFDLRGAELGKYDVRVEVDPLSTQLLDAVEVIRGEEGQLRSELIVPEAVRVGRPFIIYVEYENTGDTNIVAPLFYVTSDVATLTYGDESPTFPGESVQLLGTSSVGPAGILKPGDQGRLAVHGVAVRGSMNFSLNSLIADDTPVDWDSFKEDARRESITAQEWDQYWPLITSSIGDTWADFLRVLGDNATRRSLQGSPTSSVNELFGMEIDKILGAGVSAIGGTLVSEATGQPLVGVQVGAQHIDSSGNSNPFDPTIDLNDLPEDFDPTKFEHLDPYP